MTKRYLESLPQAEQDEILGRTDDDATWMTDERKSRQFMAAMDLYFERRAAREYANEMEDEQC